MVTYEIRIGGTVPTDLVAELTPEITAIRPAGTMIEVSVADDAALWGLIDALRWGGVDLLEIRRRREGSPGA